MTINLATDFQHVGMNTQRRGNLFEFLVRLRIIAKLDPALGGQKMMRVGRRQRLHVGSFAAGVGMGKWKLVNWESGLF